MSLRCCSLVTAVGNGPLKLIVDIDVAPYVVVVLDWSVLRRSCVLLNNNQLIGWGTKSLCENDDVARPPATCSQQLPPGQQAARAG